MSLRSAVRYLEQGQWEQAHAIAQADESALGCWAHGIVHLQEGDVSNARYWYGRARRNLPVDVDVKAEVAALAHAVDASDP